MSFLVLVSLILSGVNSPPAPSDPVQWSTTEVFALAEGITQEQMADAYPPRDPANIQNWYGTSLFGFEQVDLSTFLWIVYGSVQERLEENYALNSNCS
jgi:hypothetical protein